MVFVALGPFCIPLCTHLRPAQHRLALGQQHDGSACRAQIPPLPPVLVAKAAELRAHAHALSAENDFCDTCKMVVVEAASILGNLVSNDASAPRP